MQVIHWLARAPLTPRDSQLTDMIDDATEILQALRDAHCHAVEAWSEVSTRHCHEDVRSVELLDAGNALNSTSAALLAHLLGSAASNVGQHNPEKPSFFENASALARLAALNPRPVIRLTDLGDALPHVFKFLPEHSLCNVMPLISKGFRRATHEAPRHGYLRALRLGVRTQIDQDVLNLESNTSLLRGSTIFQSALPPNLATIDLSRGQERFPLTVCTEVERHDGSRLYCMLPAGLAPKLHEPLFDFEYDAGPLPAAVRLQIFRRRYDRLSGFDFDVEWYPRRRSAFGLRVLEDVPKGAFVLAYHGEVYTGIGSTDVNELHAPPQSLPSLYKLYRWRHQFRFKVFPQGHWSPGYAVDPTLRGNAARWIHTAPQKGSRYARPWQPCSNLEARLVPVPPGNSARRPIVGLFASRAIMSGEELFLPTTPSYVIDGEGFARFRKPFQAKFREVYPGPRPIGGHETSSFMSMWGGQLPRGELLRDAAGGMHAAGWLAPDDDEDEAPPNWSGRDFLFLKGEEPPVAHLYQEHVNHANYQAARNFEDPHNGFWFPRHPLPDNDADWFDPAADREVPPEVPPDIDEGEGDDEGPGWFRQNEWLVYWPPHGVYGV